MTIVGINAYHADASAAIFVDGKLVAAIEEERINRIKHWAGFPAKAIAFCLQEAQVSVDDVTYFVIGRDTGAKLANKLRYLATHPAVGIGAIKSRLANRKNVLSAAGQIAQHFNVSEASVQKKMKFVEHHRSHLASAYFGSPFSEAACLSVDGSGDFSTTMTGIGKGNDLQVINSLDFPHSLGLFYTAFTQLLGFPHYGDEYKVMGMAPYGKPEYVKQLQKVIRPTKDGFFKLDLSYFVSGVANIVTYGADNIPVVAPLYSKKMIADFGKLRAREEPLTQHHKDLAASVQVMAEEIIFHMLNHLHKHTGFTNLCLAGGVAQNSVANGKISRRTPFKHIYVPPAGHDAGISMGAALYLQHHELNMPRHQIKNAYLGSKFSNEEIIEVLKANDLQYRHLPDDELYEIVTSCITDGGVVGWMTGRAEFGPRALGGRSIIADPRRNDAKDIINLKIKRRESFRPFAPSILEHYAAEFFEVDESAPFMERVLPIKKDKQHLIPAVTHADGSGRLQTVAENVSPRYYQLIETFRQKTGIPILLNTSFNENEPIVNTPQNAIDCFLRTNMDLLVMENILVQRQS